MKILGLDLATRTGWSIFDDGRLVEWGMQDFSVGRGESPGMRYLKFRVWLDNVVKLSEVDLVVYEQAHMRGGAATEVLVGLCTRVQEIAAGWKIDHATVHTATLKKHATGNGRAEKADMIAAAQKKWPALGAGHLDDNIADAIWVGDWASLHFAALVQRVD